MPHIREKNIHLETFVGAVSQSIVVNLKITYSLSTIEIWLDDDILESISSSMDGLEVLLDNGIAVFLLGFLFLVLSFDFLDEILDLLLADNEVIVVALAILILQS